MTIALCGKGGTGKTTLAGLILRFLLKEHKGESVLVVDADPNANLDQVLGVKAENSIVAIVDDISKNPSQIPQGTTKDRFLEYRVQDALVEAEGFDLLVMGRPEGPGCYCFVNNLLRALIEKLAKSYAFILIDNEAGMEHLSRRTTRSIDLLLTVSDYSVVGLRSAKRILDLTEELDISVRERRLLINRMPKKIAQVEEKVKNFGIALAGVIPDDQELLRLSARGDSLKKLSEDSQAAEAINKICREVIKNGS